MADRRHIFNQIRILIIDDNAVDREMVRIHLESIGLTTLQEAKSGSEGIFKIENATQIGKPFHLVITDWRMPDKDGMALLKFLKSDKAYRSIRVMMVTSVNESNMVKNAIEKGVDDFILKPIDAKLLLQKIDKLLNVDDK